MEGGGDRRVLHGPDLCDPCDRRSPDALAYGRRIAGGRAGLLFDRRISLFLFEPDGGPARSRRLFVRPKHGLVLRMSLFAGILGGLGMFVLYKWIDPEFFRQQMDLAIATYVENGWDEKAVESAGTIAARMMGNPLFVVFSGVGTMIIYGGLLGLIVSLFVKRHGDPFAGANNGQNGTTPPQSE
ncbi:DUF4199 domain-containing protein [Alistipes sp. AF48-12]|nr:DUF4199 domain-containing protein [Alistipes sp. AF48-12]